MTKPTDDISLLEHLEQWQQACEMARHSRDYAKGKLKEAEAERDAAQARVAELEGELEKARELAQTCDVCGERDAIENLITLCERCEDEDHTSIIARAVAEERKRAADCAARIAAMVESGEGELEPGYRLRQVERLIRGGKGGW